MENAVIIIGHGAKSGALLQYENLLNVLRKQVPNSHLIMLHGGPNPEEVASKLSKQGISHVTLVPILLASGHHMRDNISSPKSKIQEEFLKRGIKVSVVDKALLEYEAIREAIVGCVVDSIK